MRTSRVGAAVAGLVILAAIFAVRSLPHTTGNIPVASNHATLSQVVPPPPLPSIPAIAPGTYLTMPLDQYIASRGQQQIFLQAFAKIQSACMARYGWKFPVPTFSRRVTRDHGTQFGRSPAQASIYGYHPDPAALPQGSQPDMQASHDSGERKSQLPLPAAEWAVLNGSGARVVAGKPVPNGGCSAETYRHLDPTYQSTGKAPAIQTELAQRLARTAFLLAENDERMQAAVRRWSACMHSAGYAYRTPRQASQDIAWRTPAPSPTEIAAATADESCQARQNLIGTQAALVAAYQHLLINRNIQALTAARAALGVTLLAARQAIDSKS